MAAMSNLFEPRNRNPQGDQPTEQLWPQAGGPVARAGPGGPAGSGAQAGPGASAARGGRPGAGGNAGPGWDAGPSGTAPLWQQSAGLQEHMAKDRRKALHWTVGLVAAALLAGGGTIAGIALAGQSAPSGAASLSSSSGPTGQAALLNTTLIGADSPGALAPVSAMSGAQAGAPALGAARPCARALRLARAARQAGFPRLARRARLAAAHCRLARHRVFRFFLLRGVEGQFTFQTRNGVKTLAYERGVIESVSPGHSIVVKAADGTTWTWDLVSTTVVRDRAGKVAESSLSVGEPVWVGGPVIQGAKDARLIVIRPPSPESAPAPAPGN
jgi:hypothetical protein